MSRGWLVPGEARKRPGESQVHDRIMDLEAAIAEGSQRQESEHAHEAAGGRGPAAPNLL